MDVLGSALANSAQHCTKCHGTGRIRSGRNGVRPCACGLRGIFRKSLGHYRYASEVGPWQPRSVTLRRTASGRPVWSNINAEYCADFELIARRNLDTWHYAVFRVHFLEGADWKESLARLSRLARRMGARWPLDRGNFFHAVYRIEARLGILYAELGLYPPGAYGTPRIERWHFGRRGTPSSEDAAYGRARALAAGA